MAKIRKLTYVALMTELIAVMAQLAIPLPSGVPITLQVFAVALTGFILKRRLSLVAVVVYILLGAVGVPVFANLQGGLGILMSVRGGFIIGFLPIAFLCGTLRENKFVKILYMILSVLLCHLCGVAWFSYVANVPIFAAFLEASVWYLAKDIALVLAAWFVARAIEKRMA